MTGSEGSEPVGVGNRQVLTVEFAGPFLSAESVELGRIMAAAR